MRCWIVLAACVLSILHGCSDGAIDEDLNPEQLEERAKELELQAQRTVEEKLAEIEPEPDPSQENVQELPKEQ